MVKKKSDWEKEWQRGAVKRFYRGGKNNKTIQIGKYRGADSFDRKMKHKYKWLGKYYVNAWYPEEEKLFSSQAQAESYAKKKYNLDTNIKKKMKMRRL